MVNFQIDYGFIKTKKTTTLKRRYDQRLFDNCKIEDNFYKTFSTFNRKLAKLFKNVDEIKLTRRH